MFVFLCVFSGLSVLCAEIKCPFKFSGLNVL